MDFINILSENLIDLDLSGLSKRECVEGLVKLLHREQQLDYEKVKLILESVMERENMYSTGIGKGIAVPHARLPFIDEGMAALGISRRGIDFDAYDDKNAHIIILLLTPSDSPDVHLKILSEIVTLMGSESVIESILKAGEASEIISLLESKIEIRS